jgi:hypothetical protein
VERLERRAVSEREVDALEPAGVVQEKAVSRSSSTIFPSTDGRAHHSLAKTEQMRFVSLKRSSGTGKILENDEGKRSVGRKSSARLGSSTYSRVESWIRARERTSFAIRS